MGYGLDSDRTWKGLIVFAVFGVVMAGALILGSVVGGLLWLWQHLAWV